MYRLSAGLACNVSIWLNAANMSPQACAVFFCKLLCSIFLAWAEPVAIAQDFDRCNEVDCPVDCQWDVWSDWSHCELSKLKQLLQTPALRQVQVLLRVTVVHGKGASQ